MQKVYACLAGNWVCLHDDPDCTVGSNGQSPSLWWEENAPIYAPIKLRSKFKNSHYHEKYVHIQFRGKDYRISPVFVQIVTE